MSGAKKVRTEKPRKGLFDRLKQGLAKTRQGVGAGLLRGRKHIDDLTDRMRRTRLDDAETLLGALPTHRSSRARRASHAHGSEWATTRARRY
jgi:hypothetical protein